MDNHSGLKGTSSEPPPPPTVVWKRLVIMPDVSALTTEAPPAMLNLDDNYSSLDEAYIARSESITAGHSVKLRKKTLKNHFKICQISLSYPHSTLHNELSLLTKHSTDCPSHSPSWMPLLQSKSSISFYQLHYGTACSQYQFLCPGAAFWAREGTAAFLAASYCLASESLAGNSDSYGSDWSFYWDVLDEGWSLFSQGWITTSCLSWQDSLLGDLLLVSCCSIQFNDWNSWWPT